MNTALLNRTEHPTASTTRNHKATPRPEPLLRQALGEALRSFRTERRVTLRELAESAAISPGYLSELERGRKEVSSELLASICHALGTDVADVLIEAAGSMALSQAAEELAGPLGGYDAPKEQGYRTAHSTVS